MTNESSHDVYSTIDVHCHFFLAPSLTGGGGSVDHSYYFHRLNIRLGDGDDGNDGYHALGKTMNPRMKNPMETDHDVYCYSSAACGDFSHLCPVHALFSSAKHHGSHWLCHSWCQSQR
jgi:hypothetical protein